MHSQLHCTAQCNCGEETFELTVEQRAVLSSNRPQLVLASSHTLGWPWQGVGQPFHFVVQQSLLPHRGGAGVRVVWVEVSGGDV